MVTLQYMESCMSLQDYMLRFGVDHDWLFGRNESLVHRARMEMTRSFMTTEHTHLLFIDADIEFAVEDVGKLFELDSDIAVGVYRMKKQSQKFWTAWKNGKLVNVEEWNGPTEVDYAGTGFMLIKRTVIERLTQTQGTYQGADGRTPALFLTPIHNDSLESEDYHFCRIAREQGFKVVMDPSIRLNHIGQYAYGHTVQ